MKQGLEVISLNKIFEAIIKRILPILLITALCGALSFIYFSFFVDKQYSASVSIIVDNRSAMNEDEIQDSSQKKTNTDITASRMMAETYIAILKNKTVLASVADRVNERNDDIENGKLKPITGVVLSNYLTMNAVNNTEILQINARTTNPQLSVDICYCIVEEAKVVLQRTMNTLTVNSIEGDNILLPTAPVSPNVTSNTLIIAFLGFVVSCTAYVVIALLDQTVSATDDISKICGYPVIGEIPSIKTDAPKKPAKRRGWKF